MADGFDSNGWQLFGQAVKFERRTRNQVERKYREADSYPVPGFFGLKKVPVPHDEPRTRHDLWLSLVSYA